ncbi:hypothetical protein EU528_13645 [Candidatus Thorarchaeota archaeon]|nr:MAG: hypothetical protein EU528_13645 [Candidatus Thorarchaeota archaeon]
MDEERTWDLSILVEDTSIEGLKQANGSTRTELGNELKELREASLEIDAEELLKHIHKVENTLSRLITIAAYTNCRFLSDTTEKGSQTFASISQGNIDEYYSTKRVLYKILGQQVEQRPELLEDPVLSNYKHLLEMSGENQSYTLSQNEEELILEKDSNGISVLSQLQEMWTSSIILDVEIEGNKQKLSLNKARGLLASDDRETRRIVSEAYYGSFARDKLIHTNALRAICSDHVNMTKRRQWPSYMTQSFIDQDVDEQTIMSLLKTVEDSSSSVQDYIQLKAKHFGYKKLLRYDMPAPWNPKRYWEADWTTAKKTVIQAYATFDDEIGKYVSSLFTDRRIDSEDRPGRSIIPGVCWGVPEKKTSFIFLTYNNSLSNAYTLAHELGHGIHNYFIDKGQTFLNIDTSMCIAETGSIFGELLLTEHLLKECETDELKTEVLENVVGRFYGTTFNLTAYALFEMSLYDAIMDGQMLDAEKICEIWIATRERIFGDTIEWPVQYDYEWAKVHMLYMPNFRFYNYSYVFAQLLVFALYEDYKENPSNFSERFKRLLSRGCSMSPREQIAEMGYDITKSDFWTLGIKQAERLLDELKRIS